ncbi:hypothetical protein AAHE18_10G157300 [Arachis hypogaea]|nr:uncharacterized protein DS421_10g305860 [Arachis hypogaea]
MIKEIKCIENQIAFMELDVWSSGLAKYSFQYLQSTIPNLPNTLQTKQKQANLNLSRNKNSTESENFQKKQDSESSQFLQIWEKVEFIHQTPNKKASIHNPDNVALTINRTAA